MRNRLLSTMLLALSAAAMPAPTTAATSATASVSFLSVQLLDATTFSVVSSGITWHDVSIAQSFVGVSVFHDAAPGLDLSATGSGALPFGPVSRQVSSAYGQTQATVSGGNGTNPLTGTVLTASGSNTGSPPGAGSTGFAALAAAPEAFFAGGAQFTLAANTMAVFRATVSVTASAGVLAGADTYAEATGSLRVFGTGPSDTSGSLLPCGCGIGNQDIADKLSITASSGESFSNSGTLTVFFVNTSGTDKFGFLGAEAQVLGSTSIAPVPEPSQIVLIIPGLAVIGAKIRRRRR
jgi:hypothetical protein